MPSLPVSSPVAARLVLGTIAVAALLSTTSAVAASEPVTSDQFAPGWQADAQPLINMGFSTLPNRNRWRVPGTLARGDYVLVQRSGDKAAVLQGVRFSVSGGTADQYIFLDPGVGNVEAIPVADVPSLRQRSAGSGMR